MATETPEIGGVSLPPTEKYRVTGLGAVYYAPTEIIGADGVPKVAYVTNLATRAQVIDLVAGEARRLSALGAVKPAGDPPTYDEMDEQQLAVLATSRGVAVRSSSADPDRPLREDYINALFTHDLGSDEAVLRGVGTVPGGVITPESGAGTPEVLIDGVHPNPPTEQADSVDTSPADEAAGRIGLTSQQSADRRRAARARASSTRAARARRSCRTGSLRRSRTPRRRSRRRTTTRRRLAR
jgi:hypothetical protein